MCGIVGLITTSAMCAQDKRKFMEQALLVGTVRGSDGAGLFGVPREHSVGNSGNASPPFARWAKMAAPAPKFLEEQVAKEFMSAVPTLFAAIGHNRAATKGACNTGNTHPFVSGPITLVHNGTITGHAKLSSQLAEVDSHGIAHALAESSVEDVVKQLDGAFALVWYDRRDGYLNLIRNSQRPLHLGVSRGTDTIYIASEVEMLRWLAARLNLYITTYIQPDPGVHMRWHCGSNSLTPEISKLELKRYITTYSTHSSDWRGIGGHYGNIYADYDDDFAPVRGSNSTSSAQTTTTTVASTNTTTVTAAELPSAVANAIQKQRKVPGPMIEALADCALSPDDRMCFVPTTIAGVTKNGRTINRLLGVVGNAGVSACLMNVPSSAFGSAVLPAGYRINADYLWEVSPIGVRKLDEDNVEVICRLISTTLADDFEPDYEFFDEAMWLYENEECPLDDDIDEEVDAAEASVDVQVGGPASTVTAASFVDSITVSGNVQRTNPYIYPGVYGTKVSAARFLELTQDGCYECGRPITLAAAASVTYKIVAGKHVPNCGQCISEEVPRARAVVCV